MRSLRIWVHFKGETMFQKKLFHFFIILLFVTNLICYDSSMSPASINLTSNLSPLSIDNKPIDDVFIESMVDFTFDIFKNAFENKENYLVSPMSVMLALAMTANGADGETLAEMETLLGKGIALSDLNKYLYSYAKSLPSEDNSKLNIANSIWFIDGLEVNTDFLQENVNFFNASIYKSAFNSQTLSDINNWVKHNTDGMIKEILDRISANAIMYLINAIVFDAIWQTEYGENSIRKGDFKGVEGIVQNVDFMYSTENLYIEDSKVTGFIKPYFNNHYSFVALLPNEDIKIDDYIMSLTREEFLNSIKNAQRHLVRASMPKLEFEFEIELNEILKNLGMPSAFDEFKADFYRMLPTRDDVFISRVIHKTFISIDEVGTKAAAATIVGMDRRSRLPEYRIVRLDRPYVFAIIDNKTNIPVFIGVCMLPE